MTWEWIAILIFCGIAMLGLELIVPGGIIGFAGLVTLFLAVVVTWYLYGPLPGLILLGLEIVLIPVFITIIVKKFPQSFLGRAFIKTAVIEDEDFRHRQDELVGKSGEVVAPCHPAGIVSIDGKRHDVVSEGDFLAAGTKVNVVAVDGMHITVRPSSTD